MRRIVLGVLIGLLALPSLATTEGIHSVLHVKSSDWVGVRFVRLSEFQPKTTVGCPCKCPCSEGKPCDCGTKCECKDCPGKSKPSPRYGYKEARLDAIRMRTNLTVWVGMKLPTTGRDGMHVREELGWINPWGQPVNQPCKLEFYYEGGKIWLKEEPVRRAPAIVQRTVRAASC